MILLSLASKQIWPQVLSVLHVRPQLLVLFHSAEESESKRPAERLKEFFESSWKLAPVAVQLRRVPHDRFQGVVDEFASAAEEHALDDTNCTVNLTGGNKLMVMAAADWCRLAFWASGQFDIFLPSWHFYIMIKTQVQIPDELFERAKRLAAEKEWSFAEVVRRGLEQITGINPPGRKPASDWRLPKAAPMGLPLAREAEWTALSHEDTPR